MSELDTIDAIAAPSACPGPERCGGARCPLLADVQSSRGAVGEGGRRGCPSLPPPRAHPEGNGPSGAAGGATPPS
jgi:hypothetical protein